MSSEEKKELAKYINKRTVRIDALLLHHVGPRKASEIRVDGKIIKVPALTSLENVLLKTFGDFKKCHKRYCPEEDCYYVTALPSGGVKC